MSKHTPGPWFQSTVESRIIRGDDGNRVVAVVDIEYATRDTINADARLIAAAPDLLAALKCAEHFLTIVWNNSGSQSAADELHNIQDAIAKAEGQ